MLGRILRNAVRTGAGIGIDIFETLVERGESAVFGEARTSTGKSTSNAQRQSSGVVDVAPRSQTVQTQGDDSQAGVKEEAPEIDGVEACTQTAMGGEETDIPTGQVNTAERQDTVQDDYRIKAPALCMRTIRTKRTVCLHTLGKPAALIFHGQANANDAAEVNFQIQEQWFPQRPVFVANIVPLRFVPAFLRGVAESEMEKAYDKGIKRFLNGRFTVPAEEVIYIFPDWKNETAEVFELDDPWSEIEVVILNRDGCVVGKARGKDPAKEAVDILAKAGCLE